jgi:hypothetical protein
MRDYEVAYSVLVEKPEGKTPLGRPRLRWEDKIIRDLQEVGRLGSVRITFVASAYECGNRISGFIKCREFLD